MSFFGIHIRKFLGLALIGVIATLRGAAQCTQVVEASLLNPTLSALGGGMYTAPQSSGVTITPCLGTAQNTSVNAGRYITMNVVKGLQYNVNTCATSVFTNTQLTLLDTNGNLLTPMMGSSYNDDSICGIRSTLVFRAPYSGRIRVLPTEKRELLFLVANCVASTVPITVTYSALANSSSINTQDDSTSYGTNTWIGQVYKSNYTAAAPPSSAAAFAWYAGTRPETETFTETFPACFTVQSQDIDRVGIKADTFAVKFRMQSTRAAGAYLVDVTAEDGVRLYANNTLVFDQWTGNNSTAFTKVLLPLTGSSQLRMEYYESTGTNTAGFNNLTRVSNVLSNASQSVCLGGATAITGNDVKATAPISNASQYTVTYQWQRSIDTVNWSAVTGATAQNYTPADTVAGTYYYRRIANVVANNGTTNLVAASAQDISNRATVLFRPLPVGLLSGSTICKGSTGQLTLNTTAGTAPFQIIVSGTTYNSVQSGVPFATNPNPIQTTSYQLTKITDSYGCVRQ